MKWHCMLGSISEPLALKWVIKRLVGLHRYVGMDGWVNARHT